MALKSIQLCHMDPEDRANGKFSVTVWSENQQQFATFDCSSEHDATTLRNAIREHADKLRRAADYRAAAPHKPEGAPDDQVAS